MAMYLADLRGYSGEEAEQKMIEAKLFYFDAFPHEGFDPRMIDIISNSPLNDVARLLKISPTLLKKISE